MKRRTAIVVLAGILKSGGVLASNLLSGQTQSHVAFPENYHHWTHVKSEVILEDPRKVIGVMVKDSDRFDDTEGWGFEDFKQGDPRQRLVTDMRQQCLSCHESKRDSDYVYSTYRK